MGAYHLLFSLRTDDSSPHSFAYLTALPNPRIVDVSCMSCHHTVRRYLEFRGSLSALLSILRARMPAWHRAPSHGSSSVARSYQCIYPLLSCTDGCLTCSHYLASDPTYLISYPAAIAPTTRMQCKLLARAKRLEPTRLRMMIYTYDHMFI